MKILQIGVPKCGNFWLYKIIQEVLHRSGHPAHSFIKRQAIYSLAREWELNYPEQAEIDVLEINDLQHSYRISSIFKMPIDNMQEYVDQTAHVWTHSPVGQRSGEVLRLFDKKVCILRDPRDRAISAAKYYCSEYMLKYFPQKETDPQRFLEKNFDQLMREWTWHVFDYLRISEAHDIHIAFYEGFHLDFQSELARLLEYLKVKLEESQVRELQEAVSFETMKDQNPQHLQKGKSGYWMDRLSAEQVQKAEIIAGPLIRYLGYPVKKNQPMAWSAKFPHHNFEQLREEILQSQKQLYTD